MKPIIEIVREAAALTGVDPLERTRRKSVVTCRAAIALTAQSLGYSQGEIGNALGFDRTTINHLISIADRTEVRSLVLQLNQSPTQLPIELDTTFDADAVATIIRQYVLGDFKEVLCTSSHENDRMERSGTTPAGTTPAVADGVGALPMQGISPAAKKPHSVKGGRKMIRSSSSVTRVSGKTGYRPIWRTSSRFMTDTELRDYAINELGMTHKEFVEARADTRVNPTYPERHQAGA